MDTRETETTLPYIELAGAEGAIEAQGDLERLDELTERLATGEFLMETDKTIPCKCKDERLCAHMIEGPNAAGGILSLLVADDLTTRRFAAKDGTTVGALQKMITYLQEQNLPVGAHGDEHHVNLDDPLSGCGANDKLAAIYAMIARKIDTILEYVQIIRGDADRDGAYATATRAQARTRFSSGKEVFNTVKNTEDAQTEILEGEHTGSVAVINLRSGTTLDREAIEAEFGPEYRAFCDDFWSFPAAAAAISERDNETEIQQKTLAMDIYNIATSLVLCGPGMRVVIVR